MADIKQEAEASNTSTNMKIVKLLFLCLLFAACNTPKIAYDYDQNANFSNYSTYALFPEFHSGLSQLDEQRIVRALDNAMEQKGFSNADNPGIFVNVYTEKFQEESNNSVGVGIGGGGGNMGVGVSGGIPIGGPETFLRMTIDFIDREKDSLVWQAIIDTKFDPNLSPEERQALFSKIIKRALEAYPPEK
ncbi:DUF4136 domain-containing protein [Zunongwangia sp. F363]|uniref:DUF4136 domain-containing protein n=1 Tax=Autumnicola tepida TaxID=3075595 RepID=A0ABU3C546_9FLAO|nr:DUF4136 domain-containing protein [Zunongwangia sp. F363]MDT0641465.1 DUF4136 domain-containing protein [Zunongwangia sp. F363]